MRRLVPALLLVLAALSCGGHRERPDLQRVLDGLVTGPDRVVPGVVAYVSGPHGTWIGTAGVADVRTRQPMRPGLRMHLDSNTKAWTATLILQLAAEGAIRLDDPLARYLPGVLPYAGQITIRELLDHTSGLVDDNDFDDAPMRYLNRVRDPERRAELIRWARVAGRPHGVVPLSAVLELTAAQPLLLPPGTAFHYSNIGYGILGLVAERVAGEPLRVLFRDRIAEPLGLAAAVYDPHGPLPPPHAREYRLVGGRFRDATGWYRAVVYAGGGMVATASDEAGFLQGLMRGRLFPQRELAQMTTPTAAAGTYGFGIGEAFTACGRAWEHGGATYATTSAVYVSRDGSRVAVLLANGNGPDNGQALVDAAGELFCAA